MRRVFVIVAVAVLALACSVREGGVQNSKEIEVRFNVSGVRSGTIATKSVEDGTVEAALAATGATGVPQLELQSLEVGGRHYTVSVGETVSIPIGTYSVMGRYVPAQKVTTIHDNGVYREPEYVVSAEVEIREGVTSYDVPASYDCWALVVDKSDVSGVNWKDSFLQDWRTLSVPDASGGLGVLYVSTQASWEGTAPTYWKFDPKDEVNNESREYMIVTRSNNNGYMVVRPGRWYLFGTNAVEREDGEIGITLGGWQKGE